MRIHDDLPEKYIEKMLDFKGFAAFFYELWVMQLERINLALL